MTNSQFRIKGNCLEILDANDVSISLKFRWPIAQVLPVGRLLIVRTEPNPGSCDNQNVFAVDERGDIVWTVSPRKHVYDDSPYTNVEEKDSKILLFNWDGLKVTVDPLTLDEESEAYGR